jgi:DNA-binding transcriptional MerR regulator
MVRKHYWQTRARAKRTRPKTRAPSNGWVIAELSRITGTSIRAIRYYVERGLITYLERRGTATRYSRASLVRLLAVPAMQFELKASLAEIKKRMEALGDEGLEAWVRARPLTEAAAAALGIDASNGANAAVRGAAHAPDLARVPPAKSSAETLYRVRLLPGLDLILSADAGAIARAAAERIQREFLDWQ